MFTLNMLKTNELLLRIISQFQPSFSAHYDLSERKTLSHYHHVLAAEIFLKSS